MKVLFKKMRFLLCLMTACCLLSCQAKPEPVLISVKAIDSARLSVVDNHQSVDGHTQAMIGHHNGSRSLVKLSYSYAGRVAVGQEIHVPLVFSTSQAKALKISFSLQPSVQLLSPAQATIKVDRKGQAFYELVFIPVLAGKHYIKFMLNIALAEQTVVQMMSIPVYVADSDGKIPAKSVQDVNTIDLPLRQL